MEKKKSPFRKIPISRCDSCPTGKKIKKGKFTEFSKAKIGESISEGNEEVLIINTSPNTEIDRFMRILERNGIYNYKIVYTHRCNLSDMKNSYSLESVLHCNNVNIFKGRHSVILVAGMGLNSVTKTNDINSWRYFNEYLFNPTFFYSGYESFNHNRHYVVYPIPMISDIIRGNSIETYFFEYQIKQVLSYLKNKSVPKFKKPILHKVEDPNEFLQQHMDKKEMAWDLETSGLDHFSSDFRVGCMTIAFDEDNGYYLPFDKINKRLLSKFMSNKFQITAGGKYDCKAMAIEGVTNAKVDEDINLLYHVLNTERRSNSLGALSWFIGLGGYDNELHEYVKKYTIKNYLDIPERLLFKYATLDAVVTYRLYKYAKNVLVPLQPKVYDLYKNTYIPVIPVFQDIEMNGMEINYEYLSQLNEDLKKKEKVLERKICNYLHVKINIGSTQQLARAIEEKTDLQPNKRGKKFYVNAKAEKKYFYSIDDEVLKKWKKEGSSLAEMILDYRATNKLRTAFVGKEKEERKSFFSKQTGEIEKEEGIVKFIRDDRKIHTNYLPAITKSGRSASYQPNVQQFPKQEEKGKLFRPVIACPEDYFIGEIDYSGFQLRIACIYSKDETMENIFLNLGGDIHSVTAQSIFCRDETVEEFLQKKKTEPYKTYRFKAKSTNFGFLFGRSAFGFKPTLEENWTNAEIQEYIEDNKVDILEDADGHPDFYLSVANDIRIKFFDTYKQLPEWIDRQHNNARKQGYIDSHFGGRRHLPFFLYDYDLNSENDFERKKVNKLINSLYNISVNSPVQNFEAVTIYRDMRKLWEKLKENNMKTKMIGMIHDAVVFYIHKDEIDLFNQLRKECMNDYDSYKIPILSDFEIGKVWIKMNEIK